MIESKYSGSFYNNSKEKEKSFEIEFTLQIGVHYAIAASTDTTYLLLAEDYPKSEISTVNWHRKILCISISHCKVNLDFNSFTAVFSWIPPKHL